MYQTISLKTNGNSCANKEKVQDITQNPSERLGMLATQSQSMAIVLSFHGLSHRPARLTLKHSYYRYTKPSLLVAENRYKTVVRQPNDFTLFIYASNQETRKCAGLLYKYKYNINHFQLLLHRQMFVDATVRPFNQVFLILGPNTKLFRKCYFKNEVEASSIDLRAE